MKIVTFISSYPDVLSQKKVFGELVLWPTLRALNINSSRVDFNENCIPKVIAAFLMAD